MKLHTILLALLPISVSAAELSDTVFTHKGNSQVTIIESAEGLTVKTEGLPGENTPRTFTIDYPRDGVVKSKQSIKNPLKFNGLGDGQNNVMLLNGLHFGFCGLGGHDRPDIQMGKSFEIGIENLILYQRKLANCTALNIGMGINWRNYRITGTQTRFILDNGNITQGAYPEGCEGKYSHIKVFSLGFPITWYQTYPVSIFGKTDMATSLGVILNWNSHASLSTRYNTPDGIRAEYFNEHLGQRKFSVDLYAAVKIASHTGLYFKYSPQTLFKQGRGPACRTFSTGITFLF